MMDSFVLQPPAFLKSRMRTGCGAWRLVSPTTSPSAWRNSSKRTSVSRPRCPASVNPSNGPDVNLIQWSSAARRQGSRMRRGSRRIALLLSRETDRQAGDRRDVARGALIVEPEGTREASKDVSGCILTHTGVQGETPVNSNLPVYDRHNRPPLPHRLQARRRRDGDDAVMGDGCADHRL